jgi:hypothetical protein
MSAEETQRQRVRGILLKMRDFDGLHYTLFPRLRWEKEASQQLGRQYLFLVATNMLVLILP